MQKGNAINVAQSRALAKKLEQSSGFVTVTFVKKDGSVRKMNCRMGVSKYLKGGESTLDANQYVTVYDMAKASYRAVNRDTIVDIKGIEG